MTTTPWGDATQLRARRLRPGPGADPAAVTHNQRERMYAATVAIPVAFLAVFFAWPLVAILERSLVADGTLDVPWDVLTAESTREINPTAS